MRYLWTIRLGEEPNATVKWSVVAEEAEAAIAEARRLHAVIYKTVSAGVWRVKCGPFVEGIADELTPPTPEERR